MAKHPCQWCHIVSENGTHRDIYGCMAALKALVEELKVEVSTQCQRAAQAEAQCVELEKENATLNVCIKNLVNQIQECALKADYL